MLWIRFCSTRKWMSATLHRGGRGSRESSAQATPPLGSSTRALPHSRKMCRTQKRQTTHRPSCLEPSLPPGLALQLQYPQFKKKDLHQHEASLIPLHQLQGGASGSAQGQAPSHGLLPSPPAVEGPPASSTLSNRCANGHGFIFSSQPYATACMLGNHSVTPVCAYLGGGAPQ